MDLYSRIQSILKKKKESIVMDIMIKDYDQSNFYIALVFNKKIEKFKVLYVPIDAIKNKDSIEEYFCYQFIFLETVNYILETIHNNEKIIENSNFHTKKIPTMNSYSIEINTHVAKKDFNFLFTQYIDKEYTFLFDVIVILFEHVPNIMNEVCQNILLCFTSDEDIVRYTGSFELDISHLESLFSKEVMEQCKYKVEDIDFLEQFGNRYYAIINNELIIIDYTESKKLFNVYSGNYEVLGPEVYIATKAIQKKHFKDFYHIEMKKSKEEFENNTGISEYYLCYGIKDDYFQVISEKNENRIDLDILKERRLKIHNGDSKLINEIKKYLEKKYTEKRINEIINYITK